jgi:hypothetical protein
MVYMVYISENPAENPTFPVGFPAFSSFEIDISRLNKVKQTQQRNSRNARTGASRCCSRCLARTCMM